MRTELANVLLIVFGVAFLWWALDRWGRYDPAFEARRIALLTNRLAQVVAHQETQLGMGLFALASQEANLTRRLLDCALDEADRPRIARQHCAAVCRLVSMGEIARADDLKGVCQALGQSPRAELREVAAVAECELAFEWQYQLRKHDQLIQAIAQVAAEQANGDVGRQLAERLMEHRQTQWRAVALVPEIKALGAQLPQGNSLGPKLPFLLSRLIEIESAIPETVQVQEFGQWLARTEQLMAEYPRNSDFCGGIVACCDRLSDLGCFDESARLIDAALSGYQGSDHPAIQAHLVELKDRHSAAQIGVDRWKRLVRESPEQAEAMVEKVRLGTQRLVDEQRLTDGVVDRLLDLSRAIENEQQYGLWSDLGESLLKTVPADSAARDRVADFCAASSRRAALVGQPFQLPSDPAVAESVDAKMFRDRITAVVFWSARDRESMGVLLRLDELYRARSESGFGMLAINVDRDLAAARRVVSQAVQPWPVVIAAGLDGTGQNPLAVAYGIQQTPYLVLVDATGKVADVALPADEIWDRAVALMPSLKPTARRGGPRRMSYQPAN
jgi:hypothetical protein